MTRLRPRVKYYDKEEGEITPPESDSDDEDYNPDEEMEENLGYDGYNYEKYRNSGGNNRPFCSMFVSMLVGIVAGCLYMMPNEIWNNILTARRIELW